MNVLIVLKKNEQISYFPNWKRKYIKIALLKNAIFLLL